MLSACGCALKPADLGRGASTGPTQEVNDQYLQRNLDEHLDVILDGPPLKIVTPISAQLDNLAYPEPHVADRHRYFSFQMEW